MSEFIVRCSWDTGWEDYSFSDLPAARKFQKKEIEKLRKDECLKDPEKWVKVYRLEEMP